MDFMLLLFYRFATVKITSKMLSLLLLMGHLDHSAWISNWQVYFWWNPHTNAILMLLNLIVQHCYVKYRSRETQINLYLLGLSFQLCIPSSICKQI